MKIIVINGPNINLLGQREPSIYGTISLDKYIKYLRNLYPQIKFISFQSNIEGEIVDILHDKGFSSDGIILNAGAYTHTSIAIRDAISAIKTPVVEVHISNVLSREEFRHRSVIGAVCTGTIMGFGLDSYRLGVESFIKRNIEEATIT